MNDSNYIKIIAETYYSLMNHNGLEERERAEAQCPINKVYMIMSSGRNSDYCCIFYLVYIIHPDPNGYSLFTGENNERKRYHFQNGWNLIEPRVFLHNTELMHSLAEKIDTIP